MYISPSDTGSSLQPPPTPELALDDQGRARLPWKKEGYSYWNWRGMYVYVYGGMCMATVEYYYNKFYLSPPPHRHRASEPLRVALAI